MHNTYKKLTASVLLFSHMLMSCYNPNLSTHKKALPPASPPTTSQQLQGHPPEPTTLTLPTADQRLVRFSYQDGLGQAQVGTYLSQGLTWSHNLPIVVARQGAKQALPKERPTRRPRASDPAPNASPSQGSTASCSAIRLTEPAAVTSRLAQPPASRETILANLSARERLAQQIPKSSTPVSRQAKRRSRQSAYRKSQLKIPTQKQSAQTLAVVSTKQKQDVQRPQKDSSTLFSLTALGGEQVVCSQQEDGAWYAQVKQLLPGGYPHTIQLPVKCEGNGDVKKALEALQHQDKLLQKHRVHVLRPTSQHPGVVYIGRIGLLGGGNGASSSSSSSATTPPCPMCGVPTVYVSSLRGVGYQCLNPHCSAGSARPQQPSPRPSSRHATGTFHAAALQYAEKAKEIGRYLAHNSTVTSASAAQRVAWRLDDYLQDLSSLASQARNIDFTAYGEQLSQLDRELVSELAQIRQAARDAAIEMQHVENANRQINDYNDVLYKLREFFDGDLCITSVAQTEQLKEQLQASIDQLNQLAGYIGLFLGNVSYERRSAFEHTHQERVDALQKIYQALDAAARHIARAQRLEVELRRYQHRAQQIQNEFGEPIAIKSPEQAVALQAQLQDHIAYLNDTWSAMQSIGFATADDREQVQQNHQAHISSLEQLCSDIGQAAQALTKAKQVSEVLQRYQERMQAIGDEFSEEVCIEDVEQVQQMKSSLQAHIETLLALWTEIASITSDALEEELVRCHTGYLENLHSFYEELDKIEQKLVQANRIRVEVDRYQARMEGVREEMRATTSIERVEQAQQIKGRIKEHIAYVSQIWLEIEALSEGEPEEPLRQFHAINLNLLQDLYAQVEASEQRLAHVAQVQEEIDRYQARMQAIQAAFREGVSITSLEQGQQIQARLQEDLAYLMSVWEAIEKASDGTPEAQLCQFHQANLGMVQGLYDSIAKRIAEMEAQERKWSQVERYQKVLDAVNQVFGKPVAITSTEQAAEMRQSLQDHISSLEALGPIVPSHQERLEQLRQMQQSVEQQEKRLAFHALVTQQQQYVEEAFASINKSLQDSTADPKEVLGQIVLLRDWLIAEQEALGAYSSIDQQVAQGNYLHANEENVTKLLASYAHQHRIEKEEVQAIEESLRVLNLSVQESQGQPKDEQAKLQKEVAAYLQEGEKLQSQVPTSKANQEYSARGKALLQQIVQLEKETEASYQAIQKTYLSDNSDIGNQQLEKQLREKEADLASIRATKAKLLSALDIATQEIVEAYLEKVSEKPAHNGDEAGVETKNTQTEQAKGAEEKEEPKGHDDQQTSNQESKNIKTWDSITDTRIAQLDDRLQAPAKEFINTVEKQFGIQLRVTQSFRSFEEQEALYAKGRTVSGRIVTNARGGQSYHNYGLAFDVVIMRNGQAVWESLPKDIADIAISLGFEWGGNWRTFKDYPHFQMTFGQSIKELQASVSTNKK